MITLSFDSDNEIVESDDKFHNSVKKMPTEIKNRDGHLFVYLIIFTREKCINPTPLQKTDAPFLIWGSKKQCC